MAEIQLTAAQQAAVDDRDGALLVSAAAGSGKTKVLVDRLMGYVCDPVHPRDINEFLIITYTKAAAAELRGKISAELSRRLAQRPEDRHLQRQLSLVYLTEISTVHAFCASLLRAYAHERNLPSDFRVAEEAEIRQLRERTLEALLEEAYGQPDEALLAAADQLGAGRDDRGLAAAVETLCQAALCHPYPRRWLGQCREALGQTGGGCAGTVWGAYLLERFRDFLGDQRAALARALADMAGIPALEKSYAPCFRELLEQVEALAAVADWDGLAAAIPDSFGRLKAVRGFDDKALLTRLKAVRSRCQDGLKDWRTIFGGGDREAMEDLRRSALALEGALSLAERLLERLTAEKRRRRLLDFSDLEQEAIGLLTDAATGRPTAAAREIAQRFAEVLVDEYQDSNEIQEAIFSAVSQGDRNRFLVGDVKQSIYRFRLADPGIFLAKYRAFPPAAQAAPGEPRKLLLSENFRSRPEILSAVNDVFRAVMSEAVGDLTYGDDEALRPGRPFPPAADTPVELHCLEAGDEGKAVTEPRFVARRVARLLREGRLETEDGTRPIVPEDIVILLRSVNSAAPAYVEALQALGIPCASDRGQSLFDTREVETLLAILQVLDNPRRDVALAAALTSPAFAFTAQELADIRAADRQGCFYDALLAAAATMEKARAFLGQLERLREQARWLPLHSLVRLVCRETGLEAVFGAMEGGDRRRANLEAFAAFAAGRGAVTLMDFLEDMETRRRQGQGLPVDDRAGPSAVRIMSIHRSKGLEFPVVILADLSRRFNSEDLRRGVLTHPTLLVGGSVVDREAGVRYPTVAKKAIALALERESVSEELRVLYVAMTRAKSRLILTYCSKFLRTELETVAAAADRPVSPAFAAAVKNPGMWVLAAAMTRTEAGALFRVGGEPRTAQVSPDPWRICYHEAGGETAPEMPLPAAAPAAPDGQALPDGETVRRRLAFRYPHLAAAEAPSKVTATQLKGRDMDREAEEGGVAFLKPPAGRRRRPRFITEARGLTAAEKGTANHLFLQFADYAACRTAEGVAAELARLVEREFLTAEQAEAVERERMAALFTSPLGERLLAGNVVREMKFSLLVDGSLYDPRAAGEELLLQGVVDCLLDEPDGLTVIDFKTDRVRPGGEGERAAYYAGQLRAYALALARIYQKPVRRRILYFLATDCPWEIPGEETT